MANAVADWQLTVLYLGMIRIIPYTSVVLSFWKSLFLWKGSSIVLGPGVFLNILGGYTETLSRRAHISSHSAVAISNYLLNLSATR